MSAPLCFIDTETDGVHPLRKVWEVAMIRREDVERDDGVHEVHETSVDMFVEIDLSTADPFGLKVGGFYDRHPLGKWLSTTPPGVGKRPHNRSTLYGTYEVPSEAADVVARMTHGAHLVGAVPSFDAEVLSGLLRDHRLTPAWHYHLVDVEAMAVGYLNGQSHDPRIPLSPPWKSDDLALMLGVDLPADGERHTALGDARWAMRMYDAMTGGVS